MPIVTAKAAPRTRTRPGAPATARPSARLGGLHPLPEEVALQRGEAAGVGDLVGASVDPRRERAADPLGAARVAGQLRMRRKQLRLRGKNNGALWIHRFLAPWSRFKAEMVASVIIAGAGLHLQLFRI